MQKSIKKYLSILDYPFSKTLFKCIIGSEENFNKLLKKEIIHENDTKYYYNVNENFERYKFENDEKYKLYEQLLDKYYIPKCKKMIKSDYKEFISNKIDYFNMINYQKIIYDENKSIEWLFKICKRAIYWGVGEYVIQKLNEYKEDNLNKENILWKKYYILLYYIITKKRIKENVITNFLNETKCYNKKLYNESLNLLGIYYMKINNIGKASNCFDNIVRDDSIDIDLIKVRAYENLSICFLKNNNIEEAKESLKKANEFEDIREDLYETAKYNYFKMCILRKSGHHIDKIFSECEEYIKITDNNMYPDIERNFYNLISELVLNENDFEVFIQLKLEVLMRDLILYEIFFKIDFIVILEKIKEYYKKIDIMIIKKTLLNLNKFFEEYNFNNESILIKLIDEFIETKKISYELIKDQDFRKFVEDYFKDF